MSSVRAIIIAVAWLGFVGVASYDSQVRAAEAELDTTNALIVSLGWSFGIANSPFAPLGDSGERDSAPLVALNAHVNEYSFAKVDLLLALANFGRLVSELQPGGAEQADSATAVRRAILADMSALFFRQSPVALNLNAGFVFDAQGQEEAAVKDASAYLLLGPHMEAVLPAKKGKVSVDLLVGQSEVMTGADLFSQSFDKDILRFRPRLHFTMIGLRKGTPISVGMWADMGFSDKYGDTYEVFVSFPIWDSREAAGL